MKDPLDPMAGPGAQPNHTTWKDTPDVIVGALNVLAVNAGSREELREWIEMLGLDTENAQLSYREGLADRRLAQRKIA